jgi:predicted dehydrogenase
MSEKKVRVGIVGAGGISQVTHIPNLKNMEGVTVSAICDADAGRASAVADRLEINSWFDDPEKMMKNSDLDCVIITASTITHLPISQIALENGVDVLMEKPFARTAQEARRIVQIADDNDRIVMAGMNHRFREDTSHLKDILASGDMGDLFMVHCGWLKRLGVWGRPYWFMDPNLAGGGVLMDLGLQIIDLVLFLLDYPTIIEARCGTSNKVLGLDVEDTAGVFLRFENEAVMLMEVSWANCATRDLAYTFFASSLGRASLNPLHINQRQGDRIISMGGPVMADEAELYRRSFNAEMMHFIDCVRDRNEPMSSGREAIAAIETVEMLYASV